MHRNSSLNFRNLYIVFICVICLLSGILFSSFFLIGNPDTVLGGLFARTDRTDKTPDDVTPVTDTVQLEQLQAEVDKYTQIMSSPYLMVVNSEQPLPEDYEKPNLNELSANPSMELDEVAATQIERFFADAQAAGYKYVITGAYRTAAAQTEAYNTALQANLRAGYTTAEAEALASKSVAKAGESEYQTGLIISFTENRSMTAEEFMQTDFYKYVSENIHKYGFVQRYPTNKEAITGYSPSPFVYRYVGDVESATYIHQNGLSLEEYNDYISQQKAFAEQRLSSLKSGNS